MQCNVMTAQAKCTSSLTATVIYMGM